MDAVMPALNDLAKPLLQAFVGVGDCLAALVGRQGAETGGRDSEDASPAIGMDDPSRKQVAEEPLAGAEELVEERLDHRQAQDVFAFHHLARSHAPAPI